VATLAELQAQLEAVKAARRSGVRETQFGERRTVFRSDRELTAAISALEDEIAALQGTGRVRNVVLRLPPDRGW